MLASQTIALFNLSAQDEDALGLPTCSENHAALNYVYNPMTVSDTSMCDHLCHISISECLHRKQKDFSSSQLKMKIR
jgi:hypothetical protein